MKVKSTYNVHVHDRMYMCDAAIQVAAALFNTTVDGVRSISPSYLVQ